MSREAKRLQWARQIEAWRGSGLSRRAWCELHGVQRHTFDYWCRRLSSDSALLPVMVEVVSTPTEVAIEAVLGNGVTLRVPPSLPSGELLRWLQALRAC